MLFEAVCVTLYVLFGEGTGRMWLDFWQGRTMAAHWCKVNFWKKIDLFFSNLKKFEKKIWNFYSKKIFRRNFFLWKFIVHQCATLAEKSAHWCTRAACAEMAHDVCSRATARRWHSALGAFSQEMWMRGKMTKNLFRPFFKFKQFLAQINYFWQI